MTARSREVREIAAEIAAQRTTDERARPVAAMLLSALDAAIDAHVAQMPACDLGRGDARSRVLGIAQREVRQRLEARLDSVRDYTNDEAHIVLVRCGLIPAGAKAPDAQHPPTSTGAPEPPAGAPARLVAVVAAGRTPSAAPVAAVDAARPLARGSVRACVTPAGVTFHGPSCALVGAQHLRRYEGESVTEFRERATTEANESIPRCACGRRAEVGPMCQECADADSTAFGRECADRGAAAREAVAEATASTVAVANDEPRDPNKRTVTIDGHEVALYRVRLADGRTRWISTPLVGDACGGFPVGFPVMVADEHGRGVHIATMPARGRKHAENRARVLFGASARVM